MFSASNHLFWFFCFFQPFLASLSVPHSVNSLVTSAHFFTLPSFSLVYCYPAVALWFLYLRFWLGLGASQTTNELVNGFSQTDKTFWKCWSRWIHADSSLTDKDFQCFWLFPTPATVHHMVKPLSKNVLPFFGSVSMWLPVFLLYQGTGRS